MNDNRKYLTLTAKEADLLPEIKDKKFYKDLDGNIYMRGLQLYCHGRVQCYGKPEYEGMKLKDLPLKFSYGETWWDLKAMQKTDSLFAQVKVDLTKITECTPEEIASIRVLYNTNRRQLGSFL